MPSAVSVGQVAELLQQIAHEGLTRWDVQAAIEQGPHLGLALLRKEVLAVVKEGREGPSTFTPQITPSQNVSDLSHLEEIRCWLSEKEIEPGATQLLLRDARKKTELIVGVLHRITAWLMIGEVSGRTSDFARAYEEALGVRPMRTEALTQVVRGITVAMEQQKK